jgi:trehalose synthase
MLEPVYVGQGHIEEHVATSGEAAVEELRRLAAPLRGLRVLHLNATPYGGGVAEILRSEVPLLRDLGLDVEWRLVHGDQQFFETTKALHNGLQGSQHALTPEERWEYMSHSEQNARDLDGEYDVIVVHDPQPLALRSFRPAERSRWIWRCHIDTSAPDPGIWGFLRDHVRGYDATVFTASEFVPPGMSDAACDIIPPAIDPLSPKNMPLDDLIVRRLIGWLGLDVDRPLMTQVSRFDRWKDPFGVLDAYRIARRDVPQLQLAMVGSMALDDPEAWDIHRLLQAEAHGDPGVHLFTNLTGVGNLEVNAVQRFAGVVVQRSVREGFGLVVSEALWKGTPVVATHAGGIPLQMPPEAGDLLVDTIDECADRVVWLLRHRDEACRIGLRGRERVADRYLITRLLRDDLRLYARVIEGAHRRADRHPLKSAIAPMQPERHRDTLRATAPGPAVRGKGTTS